VKGTRGSSVDIATGYEMEGRVWFPAGERDIFFTTASRLTLVPIHAPILWVQGALSLEVKRPEREADHLLLSSAEVKNGRVIPPFPRTSSWRGAQLIKHRKSFTSCTLIFKWSNEQFPPPLLLTEREGGICSGFGIIVFSTRSTIYIANYTFPAVL
jgi:hypothetical protein